MPTRCCTVSRALMHNAEANAEADAVMEASSTTVDSRRIAETTVFYRKYLLPKVGDRILEQAQLQR